MCYIHTCLTLHTDVSHPTNIHIRLNDILACVLLLKILQSSHSYVLTCIKYLITDGEKKVIHNGSVMFCFICFFVQNSSLFVSYISLHFVYEGDIQFNWKPHSSLESANLHISRKSGIVYLRTEKPLKCISPRVWEFLMTTGVFVFLVRQCWMCYHCSW